MTDISVELLKTIREDFGKVIADDSFLKRYAVKVSSGSATLTDCQEYSKRIGEILGNILRDRIKFDILPGNKFYWNIAEKILTPLYKHNHSLVNEAASEVQSIIDSADGINLGSVTPDVNYDKINGIIENVTEDGISETQLAQRIFSNTQTITESFFDDFVRENCDFRYQCGMDPQVIRYYNDSTKSGTCKWCKSLAGTYDYSEVKDTGNNVWRRHSGCHCQVIYKNNGRKYMQGAHTKRVSEKLKVNLDEGTAAGNNSGSVRRKSYRAKKDIVDKTLTPFQEERLKKYMVSKGYKRISEMTPSEYYKVIRSK